METEIPARRKYRAIIRINSLWIEAPLRRTAMDQPLRRTRKDENARALSGSDPESTAFAAVESLPRRPLRRVPGRALPARTDCASQAMFHSGGKERSSPAFLVVLSNCRS